VLRGGLILRVLGASILLAVIVGAVFAVLLRAIIDGREAALLARHSQAVLSTERDQRRVPLPGHEL
jgi:hypothetical protein